MEAKTMNATNERSEHIEVGDDLVITKMTRRATFGGTWVIGRLNGHRFEALVFPEHATNAEWEIGDSRISKLWLQRLDDERTVFNWDRGQDMTAATPEAQRIVDFLCDGIAEFTFGC
jgi:hypothetical protein